jgi:hypothetical protein
MSFKFSCHAVPQGQNVTLCENSSITIITLFTAPASTPTAPYTVFGYRQGAEVVHQYWNAARERFYLGGAPGATVRRGTVRVWLSYWQCHRLIGLISVVCCYLAIEHPSKSVPFRHWSPMNSITVLDL